MKWGLCSCTVKYIAGVKHLIWTDHTAKYTHPLPSTFTFIGATIFQGNCLPPCPSQMRLLIMSNNYTCTIIWAEDWWGSGWRFISRILLANTISEHLYVPSEYLIVCFLGRKQPLQIMNIMTTSALVCPRGDGGQAGSPNNHPKNKHDTRCVHMAPVY